MSRHLTAADILPAADYEKIRGEKRAALIARKKNRRVAVGPHAMFYFENYDTMWLQVQEMLRIEKGGKAQLAEELRAYNPLIPQGAELTATVMFEIEDAARRAAILATLGGVEDKMEIRIGGEIIRARPEQDLDYTSEEGKASSVQFVHFEFAPAHVATFQKPGAEIILAITHPHYGHMAVIPEIVRQELAGDFA